jgi:hypothetical protein
MTRGLTPAALAAVTGEVVSRTLAVELDFPSGFVRACGAHADLTIDGQVYLGVGLLGSVSAVEEAAELRSYGLVVQLSGIPRTLVAASLTEAYQGRRATVWEVPLGSDGLPVASPILIFRGRMDVMEVSLGAEGVVRVKLENRLADWERPRISRYTPEEQQRLFPGDRGLDFVPKTTEKEILWPAGTFFRERG